MTFYYCYRYTTNTQFISELCINTFYMGHGRYLEFSTEGKSGVSKLSDVSCLDNCLLLIRPLTHSRRDSFFIVICLTFYSSVRFFYTGRLFSYTHLTDRPSFIHSDTLSFSPIPIGIQDYRHYNGVY